MVIYFIILLHNLLYYINMHVSYAGTITLKKNPPGNPLKCEFLGPSVKFSGWKNLRERFGKILSTRIAHLLLLNKQSQTQWLK